jgi:hypothetical protein
MRIDSRNNSFIPVATTFSRYYAFVSRNYVFNSRYNAFNRVSTTLDLRLHASFFAV